MKRIPPTAVGWRLGRAGAGVGGPDVWVPFDRTTLVMGPQGSGKTLSVLAPALLDAPGGCLVTLTKPEDVFLTVTERGRGGRPVAVLDPFNLTPGLPELVWDPVAGCEDPAVAERRAKAFAAGTVHGSSVGGDQAARFYAGECAKVLQGFLHAAAITGKTLDDVLGWVANPAWSHEPADILRRDPRAELHWHGLLHGALHGDDRTAGNTVTTLQQAMALFFQGSIRRRCVPSAERPATDLAALILAGGTIYLLGREDPYASASPLMTAVAEHVLDTAKTLGETAAYGRLCPPFLACLDELPSTAPIPTLATRMANERGLGVSFILAAQTWRQLVVCYGEEQARTIYGLSNNMLVFGGGKDVAFYRELADLIGTTTHLQVHAGADRWINRGGRTWLPQRVPVIEPSELRQLPAGMALLVADSCSPVVVRPRRCIDGRRGRGVRDDQNRARAFVRAAATP